MVDGDLPRAAAMACCEAPCPGQVPDPLPVLQRQVARINGFFQFGDAWGRHRHYAGRGVKGVHSPFVVDHPPVRVNASIARLPDSLVPVPGRANVHANCPCRFTTGNTGLAQPEELFPSRMRAGARSPAASKTGFPDPASACVGIELQLPGRCPRTSKTVKNREKRSLLILAGTHST